MVQPGTYGNSGNRAAVRRAPSSVPRIAVGSRAAGRVPRVKYLCAVREAYPEVAFHRRSAPPASEQGRSLPLRKLAGRVTSLNSAPCASLRFSRPASSAARRLFRPTPSGPHPAPPLLPFSASAAPIFDSFANISKNATGHFPPSLFIASTFVMIALSAGVMSVGMVPVFVFLYTAPGTPGVKSEVTSLPVFVAKARMSAQLVRGFQLELHGLGEGDVDSRVRRRERLRLGRCGGRGGRCAGGGLDGLRVLRACAGGENEGGGSEEEDGGFHGGERSGRPLFFLSTLNTFSHQLPGSGASVRSSKRVNSLRKVRGMSSVAPLRFLAMMSVALPSASALASSVSA